MSALATRSERLVETGFWYAPGDPVRVRVAHREHRIDVSDDGGAVDRAGRPPGWRAIAERLGGEFDVNISRHGIVSLPVVPVGPGEAAIISRIGAASLALYQELLDVARV